MTTSIPTGPLKGDSLGERMANHGAVERETLDAGIERLNPLLKGFGFHFSRGGGGVSSGGPFAVGRFVRGPIEVSLIVRNKDQLGSPNYSRGEGFAGHADLFAELGHTGLEVLVRASDEPFHHAYAGKDGRAPFEALYHDLESVILPALRQSERDFLQALDRAVERHQLRLSGHSPNFS